MKRGVKIAAAAVAIIGLLAAAPAFYLWAKPKVRVAYYEHRVEAGDEAARLQLARLYFWQTTDNCDDPAWVAEKELAWLDLLEPAYLRGDPEATYQLASQISVPMCSQVTEERKDMALRMMETNAGRGHIPSMSWLAGRHFNVSGSAEEVAAAQLQGMVFLMMAADAGDARSQAALGHRLMYGNFIQPDVGTAAKYLQKAVDQGVVSAKTDLGIIHIERMYEYSIPREGLRLLTEAAGAGDAEAAEALGVAYLTGDAIPRNGVEARKWMTRAAPERARARYLLAHFHEEGVGGEVDLVNAYAMWSVVKATGSHDDAADRMDELEQRLSASDLAKAQKIARRYAITHRIL